MRHANHAHSRYDNAAGNRAAHGLLPNTATLEAIAQYVRGGLVQWPTSSLRRGLSQSPLSSMLSATLV